MWRLPLPTATDPFGLRWFANDELLAPHATNGYELLPRFRAAETALQRLLSRDAHVAMGALETTVGLIMGGSSLGGGAHGGGMGGGLGVRVRTAAAPPPP